VGPSPSLCQGRVMYASPMAVLVALLASLRAAFRTRAGLQLEVLALRHQLAVYQRCRSRAQTKAADRLLWAWFSRTWTRSSSQARWFLGSGVASETTGPISPTEHPADQRSTDRCGT